MEKIDYITPIREILEEKLHRQCVVFMAIGSPDESPRWINYREYDEESRILILGSTIVHRVWIKIQCPEGYPDIYDNTEFWAQFKKFRTEFLLENYPTISPY